MLPIERKNLAQYLNVNPRILSKPQLGKKAQLLSTAEVSNLLEINKLITALISIFSQDQDDDFERIETAIKTWFVTPRKEWYFDAPVDFLRRGQIHSLFEYVQHQIENKDLEVFRG